jgi:membrane protease YdiL (CAAX protease family)
VLLFASVVACVDPRPTTPRPPAADRYERAADPDPARRGSAAAELAFDPRPEAVKLLLVLLQRDVDPEVRADAARAIASRRDPSLEPALAVSASRDPDPVARSAAAAARQRLWAWRKRPGTAAGLSALCPGCGQLYLGDPAGYLHLSATAALIGSSIALLANEEVALDGTARSAKVPIGLQLITAGQNLWFYSIFDAYRDARVARDDAGYKFAITRESLPELIVAPFRPDVLASPWVWAGVPLALAIGVAVSYLVDRAAFEQNRSIFEVDRVNVLGRNFSRGAGFAAGSAYYAGLFIPVGVGEEALFRGVIQTELEERFGPTGGLFAASAIFGAVHVFNFLDDPATAAIAVPVISILGSALGLAYQRTGHKLSTSVAMHFWYDVLLSAVAFAADPEHQPFVVRYGVPM